MMFQRLLSAIASDVTHMIFRVRVTPQTQPSAEMEAKRKMAMKGAEEPKGDFKEEAKEIKNETLRQGSGHELKIKKGSNGKVGRNDPCPCGSGKKYKKCCGK